MQRLYVFGDEAGCFGFHRKPGASRYFIVCTIALDSCAVGHALSDLRRDMLCHRIELGPYFHAAPDKQPVRDEVFNVICQHDFTVQATIMEKSKAQPQTRSTKERFYKYGWFYHFQYVAPKIIKQDTEVLITMASIGKTHKHQAYFTAAVNDVVQQIVRRNQWITAFCPAIQDPCLQVADYCTWAIQRKWEKGDERSHVLIADRITHEVDMWEHGQDYFY